MSSNIDEIITQLDKNKKRYWKKSEFYDFLKKNNFSLEQETLFQLIQKLDPNDVDYQSLIADLVSDISQNKEEFFNFTLNFAKIVSGQPVSDAQFFNSLVLICEQNPDIGFELAKKFIEDSNSNLLVYTSLCLGISGCSNEKTALSLNDPLLSSDNSLVKATGIRTLRIMYKKIEPTKKEEIFQILLDNSNTEVDLSIRIEVLVGLFDIHRLDPKLCNHTIHNLIEQDVRLRLKVADTLQYWPLPNPPDTMELIQHCMNHENYDIRRCCYFALTHLVENFPKEIVGIIYQNIEDFGFDYGDASYLLEELGKKNFDSTITIISKWINDGLPFRIRFHIPNIVNALVPKNNLSLSLSYIKQWLDDPNAFDLGLKIAKEIVSSQYKKTTDEKFLDSLFDILQSKALENKLDLKKVLKGETDKIFKCGQVIDALLYFSNDLDYNFLFSNLQKYPNIESFIGIKWFQEKKKNT